MITKFKIFENNEKSNLYYVIRDRDDGEQYYAIVHNNNIIYNDFYSDDYDKISITLNLDNKNNNIMIDKFMNWWFILYETDTKEKALNYIKKEKETKKFNI